MRRGQHNSGLTGGPINGTKLPEPMIEVIVAPTVVDLTPPKVETFDSADGTMTFPEMVEAAKAPIDEGSRVVKPVKPKIRPKGK